MKLVLGVATTLALMSITGCGGVAELDSSETGTVSQAESIVAKAKASGSLKPGDGDVLTDFMTLCREKPLSEVDGRTLRETMDELAARLKGVDKEFFGKLNRLATNGCD